MSNPPNESREIDLVLRIGGPADPDAAVLELHWPHGQLAPMVSADHKGPGRTADTNKVIVIESGFSGSRRSVTISPWNVGQNPQKLVIVWQDQATTPNTGRIELDV